MASLSKNPARCYWTELPKPEENQPVPWKYVKVGPRSQYDQNLHDARITKKGRLLLPKDISLNNQPNLHVGVFSQTDAIRPPVPVFAIPGITATHKFFNGIMRHTNYPYGVVGMDLRGRGNSDKPASGSYGLENHVEDVIRTLDFFRQSRSFLIGHSFGAAVALRTAFTYPDRISGIVLLDGGMPQYQQHPEHISKGLEKAFGRLGMTFDSVQDLYKYWDLKEDQLSVDAKEIYEYDLEKTEDGKFKPRQPLHAAQEDSNSLLTASLTLQQLQKVQQPVLIVRAEHGFVDGAAPLLSNDIVKQMSNVLNIKGDFVIPGSNHYTIMTSKFGPQVATHIEKFMERYDVQRQVEMAIDQMRPEEEDLDLNK